VGSAVQPAGGHAELIPPRLAAYQILEAVEEGAYANHAAERTLADSTSQERGLAMELAYGCIRLRARLDTEIARLIDRPLSRLELPVLLWLRLGLYQLRETRVPDHAAVHESVEGLRATGGRRATGFVNGVLRAAARLEPAAREAFFPSLEADPIGHLSTYGSHPEWLLRRWLERWPLASVAELVDLDNRPPPVTLRPLGLAAAGRAAGEPRLTAVPALPSWQLDGGDPADLVSGLPAIVQDPAASAVVEYVGPAESGVMVDVCAAPGGKAIALAASRAEAAGLCVAADRSHARLRTTAEAADRHGVELALFVADGRSPPLRSARAVLLDAPCLGTGVLRRRPDARWRLNPGRLAALVILQRELLDAAAELVEPGGLIVYATCSLEPEENEEQVAAFLRRQPTFARERPPAGIALPADAIDSSGDLRVMPWVRATDGCFAVRLRRET
jgi:16S rRNA (cytosine967-C5)-methyltransferase